RKVRGPDARVRLEALRLALHVLELALDGPGLVEPDDRAGRQRLERGDERHAEERGEPLHSLEVDPLGDEIPDPVRLGGAREGRRVEGRETGRDVLLVENFPRGEDARAGDGSGGSLRRDVEGAKRGDHVAVELESYGLVHPGPEDVHDPAAAARFPGLADLRHGTVAREDEAAEERLGRDR